MSSRGNSVLASGLKSYPRTHSQAKILARLACVAVGIRAIYTVAMYVFFQPTHDELIQNMQRIRGPVSLDEASVDVILFERVANAFYWISTSVTVAALALCLGLGAWQWLRPGRLMPMICLGILVLSSLMTINALMDERLRDMAMSPENMILWALKPLLAIMLIAAYRGGKACEQYRKDAA